MGQRPGFTIREQAPAFPGSRRGNEITVEVRVWAPHNTDRDVITEVWGNAVERAGIHIMQTWARKEGLNGDGDPGIRPGVADA